MISLAAIRTAAARPLPAGLSDIPACWLVEDLNWPAARPMPDKQSPRPTELWVPGRNGPWEGAAPTSH